jgi:hypothetical protein
MTLKTIVRVTAMLGVVFATSAAPASMDAMRWGRRIVLLASPSPTDPRALEQRRSLSAWRREVAARDVTLVQISGSRVIGASDTSEALRRRYHLEPGAFQVLLLGKDGHVALRSAQPVSMETLRGTIDAMPMRRAGGR